MENLDAYIERYEGKVVYYNKVKNLEVFIKMMMIIYSLDKLIISMMKL